MVRVSSIGVVNRSRVLKRGVVVVVVECSREGGGSNYIVGEEVKNPRHWILLTLDSLFLRESNVERILWFGFLTFFIYYYNV